MIVIFSLWLVAVEISSIELSSQKYKTLLTKNYSRRWYHRIVERQSPTNPYCNLCCLNITQDLVLKDCGFHTMCVYDTDKSGSHCRGFMPVQFTEAEKYTILDAHNTLRNKVASGKELRGSQGPQPSAANMRKLEWDHELASIAERWVRQCTTTHDRCRDVERFPVGQNTGGDFASKSSHLGFIKGWYESVEYFNAQDVNRYSTQFPIPIQKYSQMIWAETYRVGCARAVFQNVYGSDVIYQEILVCNYGPSGNIPGQQMYKNGKPCSACYVGTRCESDYPALCSRIGKAPVIELQKNRTSDGKVTVINYNGCTSNFNFLGKLLLMNLIMSFSLI